MKRSALAVAISLTALALWLAPAAPAATNVGSGCAASSGAPEISVFQVAGGAPGIGANGVITSWTMNLGLTIPSGVAVRQKLKIFRPNGGSLLVVGESALEPIHGGSNTFPTRIPVHSGDLLGNGGTLSNSSETESQALFCETGNPADVIGAVAGDPPVGFSSPTKEEGNEDSVPIVASLEPDADNDGFGDETQDLCPTNAATQAPCPPPPPTTLSATTAAKRSFVTVTLTASAAAEVTVGGSVELGKGKAAKLNGGTQLVAPGRLAKFTVIFPARLKARLKQLSPKRRLALKLTVTAPGAIAMNLTVRVPGVKAPKPPRRGR